MVDGGGRNVTRFVYDAGGDRVVKLGRGGESVTIGQFWSLKGRRAATKHVFAGSTRLASKVLPPPGWTSTTATLQTPSNGTGSNPVGNSLPNETGCDPAGYNPQKCPVLPGGTPTVNHFYDDTTVRPETYYYHPDHLGSTSWVTDQGAHVHEHVEYFPYGEVWRDPRSDSDGGPVKGQRFLFTGKELDEETGLVYFGARYLASEEARWISSDAFLAAYLPESGGSSRRDLPGLGGVFMPSNLAAYSYAQNQPIGKTDPDGNATYPASRDLAVPPLGTHAYLVVITQSKSAYGRFEGRFNTYVNLSGAIPGVGKGEVFYAAIVGAHKSDSGVLMRVWNQEWPKWEKWVASDMNSFFKAATGIESLELWDDDVRFEPRLVDSQKRSEVDFDLAVLEQAASYDDGVQYPGWLENLYGVNPLNSNAWVATVAERAGASNVPPAGSLPGVAPGVGGRIPPSHFRKPAAPSYVGDGVRNVREQ